MNDIITAVTSGLFVEVGKVIEHMKAQQERIADLERALDDVCKDRDDYESHMVKLDKLLCVDPEGADREQIVAAVEKLWHRNVELIEASAPSAPAVEPPIGHISKGMLEQLRERLGVSGYVQSGRTEEFSVALYAAPQAADTDKVREAILALPLPAPTHLPYGLRYSGGDMHQLLELAADTAASMAAQAPVREVPGWQLVPIEPTPKMLHAGGFKASAVGASTTGHDSYRAMLAAAPLPAAPVQKGE